MYSKMAAPMALARFRTCRSLLSLLLPPACCRHASKSASNARMSNRDRVSVKKKQNPFVPYVEGGDPIHQSSACSGSVTNNSIGERKRQRNERSTLRSDERKTGASEAHEDKPTILRSTGKAKKPGPRPDILNQVTFEKKEQQTQIVTDTSDRSTRFLKKAEKVFDFNGIHYQRIEREDDRRLVKTMIDCNTKQRQKYGDRLLHGQQLINDALMAGVKLEKLFFVEYSLLDKLPREKLEGTKLYKVHLRHLQKWLPNVDYNSIVGVFNKPEEGKENWLSTRPTIPVTLICDHVRFGPSLGTLLHSAAAAGCERVLVMKGCIDPWNSKTLQHGLGSHFYLPILSGVNWSDVRNMIPQVDRTIFAVGMDSKKEKKLAEIQDPIDVLAEIERVKEEEMFHENETVSEASSDVDRQDREYDSDFESDLENVDPLGTDLKSDNVEKIPDVYKQAAVHVQSYEQVDYTNGHCVLVVSGNPAGISLPARKLVFDEFGVGVEVPSYAHVARLDIAMSASITLFELARQFRRKADQTEQDEDGEGRAPFSRRKAE